jgi:hypothetical protein
MFSEHCTDSVSTPVVHEGCCPVSEKLVLQASWQLVLWNSVPSLGQFPIVPLVGATMPMQSFGVHETLLVTVAAEHSGCCPESV